MSRHHSSSEGRYPAAEQPGSHRNASNEQSLPWLRIAAGGSIAWALFLLAMALYAIQQERAQIAAPGPPSKVLAVDGPPVVPVAVKPAAPAPQQEEEPLDEPLPAKKQADRKLFVDCAQIGPDV